MPSQADLDIAFAAATPVVDADIAKVEDEMVPAFMRRRVDEGIHEHRARIDSVVRDILKAGLTAVEKAQPTP